MDPSFSFDETFPVIARLIFTSPGDMEGFVTHDAIVNALLADHEGARLVAEARQSDKNYTDDRDVAITMVSWFSQRMTVGMSQWTDVFERKRVGKWAYQAKAEVRGAMATAKELSAVEGDLRLYFHLRHERDSTIAEAKRAAVRARFGEERCEVCEFSSAATYVGLEGHVCEVHHRRPLAEAPGLVVTAVHDLALLCANCHRAIHLTKPVMMVEDFQERYFPHLVGK